MGSMAAATTVFCLLLGLVSAGLHTKPVFLDKQDASAVISRQKRANAGNEERVMPASLERECLEEVCNYEEAREIFQDSYRTDIFWSVYIDGDQCADQPCKNGALCSDSVGGYDCVCKAGFSGIHCETDQTACILDKTKGCSQFCKPGYVSYECSCAWGWKLDNKDKDKCVPQVPNPCGKLKRSSLNSWESKVRNNFEGFTCSSEDCPWQAILKGSVDNVFCGAVILRPTLVLTTAQCVNKDSNLQVVVGRRTAAVADRAEQTLYVKLVHTHPRYVAGLPDNDLALVELRDRIQFKDTVVAACLPQRDFADIVLTSGEHPAVVTGWRESAPGGDIQGPLTANRLAYERLPACVARHDALVTNKMGCTVPQANVDCAAGPGSALLTLYREVFFLTGVVSQPVGGDCSQGYLYQKVSRYMTWLQPLMDTL